MLKDTANLFFQPDKLLKENLTQVQSVEMLSTLLQIRLNRSDIVTQAFLTVLLTNLCKMARFLNKNTFKVKNYMKKNFSMILEMYLRVI